MNSAKLTKQHLVYCFDVLKEYLNKKEFLAYPKELPDFSAPLFVTWKITKSDDLRGCIGTFASELLSENLPKYTVISAVNDSRFPPVEKYELEGLTVYVSVLHNFNKGKKWNDWVIGRDGIQISFEVNGNEYDGTFLPEVAEEQEWNQEETLRYLIRKSGYRGDYKKVLDKIDLTTYESMKDAMSYQEYVKFTDK